MIIYFCDRQFNILGQATTELPSGFRISEDNTVEDVESGVNTFECTISWTDDTRADLTGCIAAGFYVLKSGSKDNNYDSLYQIIETEMDTKAQEIRLYAEDAGLDLLNTTCGAAKLENKTISQMMSSFLPNDWTLNIQDAPTTTKTNEWDGESTCTERLRSVVGLWDCELYYSFRIEGLQVKEKIVNVVQRRGLQEAIPQLRLNYDIDRIITKTSIADLVTALKVTGGTPEGSDDPIDLVNYDYEYTDPVTGDKYKVDRTTGQMRNITAMDRWSSMIDEDGLWVGSFSFDTTDKSILAGQARAELQKLSTPAVNYEVDFAKLPDDVQIGDRVNIIDDNGELYLEARILVIETCEADGTQKATIGDYLLKTSGISEIVQQLADDFSSEVQVVANAVSIASEAKEIADNTYIYDHEYLITTPQTRSGSGNKIAHFTAHVYRGGVEVTDLFSDTDFTWFYKTEEGEFPVATPNTGKEIDVAISDMSYGGHIIGYFNNDENDATLQTANYRALETYNNKKLLARASTDEVRVRDLSKTTVISVSDEILVVNAADEKLASVSNLADAVWSKYAITIEGEPLNQGNNVYEDLGLLSITNSELENILVL